MAEWLMSVTLSLALLIDEFVCAASTLLQGIDGATTGFNE
jgi:hypothetical protein